MLIRDLDTTAIADVRISSATVVWEERSFPDQVLTFEIADHAPVVGNRGAAAERTDGPSADAFLAACFPLAAVHGEARVRIEGQPCPMLVEGLRTVHAWWTSWGGMPTVAPEIETVSRGPGGTLTDPRRAASFFSGGVDGLHLLMINRRLYRKDDPAYIRDVLFIHGIDIGKRARDPENERFRTALRRLEPVAAEAGVRIVPCRTNLRHLPTQPGFFEHRYSAAALAAVGHAAASGPAFMFLGGTYPLNTPVPWGSHPAVDGLFSSQRVSVIHEGSRFSRLQKVRDIADWPTALAALRPCPAKPADKANCGICEKCLRTRLELLAAGVEETAAFGPSYTPIELWEKTPATDVTGRAIFYQDLLPALRSRGFEALCRVIEHKLAPHQRRERRELAVA
ncbi:MAG TPA: hypothetical protein VGR45_15360 [Stellaceae bacterium]|nr:hypothetical protein [Stellaceae bacterium]